MKSRYSCTEAPMTCTWCFSVRQAFRVVIQEHHHSLQASSMDFFPLTLLYSKRFGWIASPTVHWQSLRDFSKNQTHDFQTSPRVLQMLQDSWNQCLRRTRPFAEAICLFQKLVSREEWSRMTYIQVRDQAVQNQWFLAQQEEVHGSPEVTSRSFSGDRHFWSYF